MLRAILFISLFFPLILPAQEDENFIHWSENRKLTWNDFKAPAYKLGDIAALSTTHLGFSYSMINGKMNYHIECSFEKKSSWGLVKTDYILQHEQGHFDIGEIFARKLMKEVSGYSFNKATFQKDLDQIYQRIVNEKETFQQLYDEETSHSRNKTKQEEWLIKIRNLLDELKAYMAYNQKRP